MSLKAFKNNWKYFFRWHDVLSGSVLYFLVLLCSGKQIAVRESVFNHSCDHNLHIIHFKPPAEVRKEALGPILIIYNLLKLNIQNMLVSSFCHVNKSGPSSLNLLSSSNNFQSVRKDDGVIPRSCGKIVFIKCHWT